MKVITGGRQTGKTSELIKMADGVPGAYIVCRSRDHVEEVDRMAEEMGCDINFPITIDELKHRKGSLTQRHKLLFDDLEDILYRFVLGTPQIIAATIGATDEINLS